MEIWKEIPSYEGYYEVSNLGNVRSITRRVKCYGGTKTVKGQLKKIQENYRGYSIITLTKGVNIKHILSIN